MSVLKLVYFSNLTGNTRRFIDKVGVDAVPIPIHVARDGVPEMSDPYLLVTPTYGFGEPRSAPPKQVLKFLKAGNNAKLAAAIAAGGNTNFGPNYCLAGHVLADKLNIPLIRTFELFGTTEDAVAVRDVLESV